MKLGNILHQHSVSINGDRHTSRVERTDLSEVVLAAVLLALDSLWGGTSEKQI